MLGGDGRIGLFEDILARQAGLTGQERENLRRVRLKNIEHIDMLVDHAQSSLKNMLAEVFYASTAGDALMYIDNLLGGETEVVKSYSATLKEIGLGGHLAGRGIRLLETRLEDILAAAAGIEPAHPLYPLAHLSAERINELLSACLGRRTGGDTADMAAQVQEQIHKAVAGARVGITGANAVLADTGTVIIQEERGNARLVSNLPPVHIVVAGIDKLYAGGEEALAAMRAASLCGAGKSIANYISYISGPSKTGDIAFQMVKGMHGPGEMHVILLDNGRKEAIKRGFGELLACIGCGACLMVCPVRAEKGTAYGYRHQGGRGLLFTVFHAGMEAAVHGGLKDCLRCGRCRQICPVQIDIPRLMMQIDLK
ncbi:MAG: LUD domain-containing protein [Peptococcaceae bacterium]|nr:LUD domain-containing protein [Peptococcaceae bacterium]